MRITLLNQYYTPDLAPTAHLSASLAEHRAALGDEVRVLTSRGGYVDASDVAASESSGNLKVSRLWTPRFGKKYALLRIMDYAAFYLQTLLRMIFMKRQDVIITLTTPPLIGLTAVAHRILHPSTKIILWNMDCYPDVLEQVDMVKSGGIASRLLRFLVRLQFRWVDHLVTLDEAMSDLLLRQYEPSKRKLPTTVIPNWERSSLFPKDEQYSPWTPNDSEAFRDKFVVLYLGNTGYGHEFETVVQAAEQLRGDALVFLFVGGGKRWQMLEEAKREKNLDNF
ncbi:MAG: glycosyltransferase family 4 protein, partial [Lacipirellulaceae bacterium]